MYIDDSFHRVYERIDSWCRGNALCPTLTHSPFTLTHSHPMNLIYGKPLI